MKDTVKWESITKEQKFSLFSYWPVAIVSILIAIGAYFIVASRKKKTDVSKEVVETVLVPEAKPLKVVHEIKDPENVPETKVEVPTVKAKTFGSKYFDDQDLSEDYEDYAANNLSREPLTIDKTSNAKFNINYLKVESSDPAKFAEQNGFEATDDFLNAWEATESKLRQGSVKIDDEYRMLATEALQSIDTHLKPENAVIILREILAARTEATRIGAVLPSVPEEQLQEFSFWSKNAITKDLATTILNRV